MTGPRRLVLAVLVWVDLFLAVGLLGCSGVQDPDGGRTPTGTTVPSGEVTDDSGFGEGG